MKKRVWRRKTPWVQRGAALLLALFLTAGACVPCRAEGENTTYTYALSADDEWIRTQDAYLPGNIYLKGMGLNAPEDLFLHNGLLYIADTGNGRVVIYNPETGEMQERGKGVLQSPAGVFVEEDGTLYVADSGLPAVVAFSPQGEEILRIGRPQSSLFSQRTAFQPKNVVATKNGNLFVVSTGTYEGLMQFDKKGEFQGFFAANSRKSTLLESIQDLLFTDAQQDRLLTRKPRQIENIDISGRDLVYSVTQSSGRNLQWSAAEEKTENALKMHNMAGANILSKNSFMTDEWNFVDVAAGPYGNSYALTFTGLIYEYDSGGNLVFSFGGRAVSSERNGLFTAAAAIDLDENGFLYVLDKERALVQVFTPTEFAVATHRAINDLESGDYEAGEQSWKAVLRLNGMSKLAHVGYGKSLFHQQRFDEALHEFELANRKDLYSDAFWELRAEWLNRNILGIFIGLIVLTVGAGVLHALQKRRRVLDPVREAGRGFLQKHRTVSDVLYAKTAMRHPIDGAYYLRHGERGSVFSATVLYLLLLLVFLCSTLLRGFAFHSSDPENTSALAVLATMAIPLTLWVAGNAMVSSINEGEGSLKNVYIMTAYALAPYLILTPFAILGTYVLTLNEAFLITLTGIVAMVWSGVNLFVGVMETHNYTMREAIKNILLTFIFMVMAVVVAAILYLIWGQVASFLEGVWAEVLYRVAY